MNEEVKQKNSTVVTVLITLLVVALIGSISFIVYDKVIKKEEVKTEENNNLNNSENDNIVEESNSQLDINSDIIKQLAKPFEVYNNSYINSFNEKVVDPNNEENILDMMRLAALNSTITDLSNGMTETDWEKNALKKDGDYYNLYIESSVLEETFKKIYGNDIKYANKSFSIEECGIPFYYDSETNKYWGSSQCGADIPEKHYFNIYKAEQKDDMIITYWYSYSYVEDINEDGISNIYSKENKYDISASLNESEITKEIDKLKSEDKIYTYKITFKKQSDGKYYVYSGEWQ